MSTLKDSELRGQCEGVMDYLSDETGDLPIATAVNFEIVQDYLAARKKSWRASMMRLSDNSLRDPLVGSLCALDTRAATPAPGNAEAGARGDVRGRGAEARRRGVTYERPLPPSCFRSAIATITIGVWARPLPSHHTFVTAGHVLQAPRTDKAGRRSCAGRMAKHSRSIRC